MAYRVAETTLNASTLDILNAIRTNAGYEYQSLVPAVTKTTDIPKVGDILFGYPALANQFINALMNRIALVVTKSATFNNPYADLKKGYLEFGETVEETFVNITKARDFNVEKAPAREFQRSLPDVRTAFHVMNYRVQYPITIQNEDLRMAFLTAEGVQDLISRIVNAVYTAAEYDEYLLFKYLMIKAIAHGKMYPVAVDNATDIKNSAVQFRAISNMITFMSDKYNASGVTTTTPKSDQYIFMDAMFDANFDVNVLASAFNMDKADYIGRRKLIDDWTTFDNERFDVIRENSDCIEEVTSDELTLMDDVVGVLIDKEWFQIYDNENQMTEKYVASGIYWNYFYNVWKTVSSSPFSNAIVFVDSANAITTPATFTATVVDKLTATEGTVFVLQITDPEGYIGGNVEFVQTEDATEKGVAIQKYGSVTFPASESAMNTTLEAKIGSDSYEAGSALATTTNVGATLTFTKQ